MQTGGLVLSARHAEYPARGVSLIHFMCTLRCTRLRAYYTLRLSVFFLRIASPAPPSTSFSVRATRLFPLLLYPRPLFNRSRLPVSLLPPPPLPLIPLLSATSTLTSLRLRPYLSSAADNSARLPSLSARTGSVSPLLYNSTASLLCNDAFIFPYPHRWHVARVFVPAGRARRLFLPRIICPDASRVRPRLCASRRARSRPRLLSPSSRRLVTSSASPSLFSDRQSVSLSLELRRLSGFFPYLRGRVFSRPTPPVDGCPLFHPPVAPRVSSRAPFLLPGLIFRSPPSAPRQRCHSRLSFQNSLLSGPTLRPGIECTFPCGVRFRLPRRADSARFFLLREMKIPHARLSE